MAHGLDLTERRELNNGFGNGLAMAFELAVTPVIFGGIGYVVDRWLGLVPLFTIVFLVFALCGTFYMAWFRYDADMKAQEQKAADVRAERSATRTAQTTADRRSARAAL